MTVPINIETLFHSPSGDGYGLNSWREIRVVLPLLKSLQESWLGRPGGDCISAFAPHVGLRNRHRGHYCKEGFEEAAAVQDLPVVPGQRVPRDEDVLRHHRLRGGKEPVPWGSIQSQTENKTREMLVSRVCVQGSLCFHNPNLPSPLEEALSRFC